MSKIILCDLDNTLLDTLTNLEELVPGFDQSIQVTYKLGGELLLPFNDASIYEDVNLNKEVLDLLARHTLQGYEVIFISQTFTWEAREAKHDLLKKLFKDDFKYTLRTYEDTIWHTVSELERNIEDIEHLIIIDDAPERLERFAGRLMDEPNVDLYAVRYPYNLNYILIMDEDRVLLPNIRL